MSGRSSVRWADRAGAPARRAFLALLWATLLSAAAAHAEELYSLDERFGAIAFSVSHLGLFSSRGEFLLLKFVLYQLHKTLGILALVLTTARLLVRARGGRPAWGADMPGWRRRPASVTHGLLYALLVAAPVLDYLTAATAPARVPTLSSA